MLFTIDMSRRRRGAQVEDRGGVVIKATPSFLWAVGKNTDTVLAWVYARGGQWLHAEEFERSPQLKGEHHV